MFCSEENYCDASASGHPDEAPANEMEFSQVSEGGKKKILIIDDCEKVRFCLKILLSDSYQIFLANDGQEGIHIAHEKLPDLIICDIAMPHKDGLACCCELKSAAKTCCIPVLMLTAKVEDEDVIKGMKAGADDYLFKPFNPDILKLKIRNCIQHRLLLKQSYVKLFRSQKAMEPFVFRETNDEHFIAILVKLIEDNLADADFNVKRLAELVNRSQTSLYRKVKQITALSIIELMRGVRLKKAADLLELQKYSVQEISEMVGYNDQPTFRKHFCNLYGMVPSAYMNR